MYLTSFLVRHFRLIQESHLTLQPGIQLFLGLNAQGKTSLIEAILFLSTSTSHRTHREEELIQWGEEVAYMRGTLHSEGESSVIECGLEKKRKIIKIDGSPLPRVGDLYGRMRTVLFAPEDLLLVGGTPPGPPPLYRHGDRADRSGLHSGSAAISAGAAAAQSGAQATANERLQ